jgi:hypothetical protein
MIVWIAAKLKQAKLPLFEASNIPKIVVKRMVFSIGVNTRRRKELFGGRRHETGVRRGATSGLPYRMTPEQQVGAS